MMKLIEDLPEDVIGIVATGKITEKDYTKILVPATEEKLKQHGKIKMLFVLHNMTGMELGAMWKDANFGMKHWTHLSHIALVTSHNWVRGMTTIFTPLFPGEVKVFEMSQLEEARAWIIHPRQHKSQAA
jgi:hypothetical protein